MNAISTPILRLRPPMALVMLFLGLVSALPANARNHSPKLRVICVAALAEHEEYIIATQNKSGRLREVETLKLRSSLIAPWIEVPREELHLCVREDRELVSKCTFVYPEGSNRALLIVLPGENENELRAQAVNTGKQAFGKGDILIYNSSSLPAEVTLGEKTVEVKAGEVSVHKPVLDEQGMFHQLVTYTNEAGDVVTCSDNFLKGNADSRDYLIIAPDPQLTLRVSSLSEFGPFK